MEINQKARLQTKQVQMEFRFVTTQMRGLHVVDAPDRMDSRRVPIGIKVVSLRSGYALD